MRRARCWLLALALLVGGLLPGAAAPARAAETAGAWTPAAPMSVGRVEHTATLLPDGEVLVVGGLTGDASGANVRPLATAERYDPATNRWTPAAPMSTPRAGHTATLLRDGRVLVVGGASGQGGPLLTTAELYNPATDRWTPAGAMTAERNGHTATLLPDGQVLVAGGIAPLSTGMPTAERYDPATNRWTPTAPMSTNRSGHTATRLQDGRVLVTGGVGPPCTKTCTLLATAERYDPATDTWTPVAPMRRVGFNHSATLLANGQVLVVGGTGESKMAERYDPSANAWSPAGSLPIRFAVGGQTATTLANGRVLVVADKVTGPSVAIYDPVNNQWALAASLGIPRDGHTATLLADGTVLVAGGRTRTPRPTATAEIYSETAPSVGACFAETGQCIGGRFLAYWQAHGGLALNGYPLTGERWEILEDSKPYVVQYFERVRMEYHPENPPPFDVLLGQFGRLVYLTDPSDPRSTAVAPAPGATYFPETGHNLAGGFRDYWLAHGGLVQFGYPLSEEMQEKLEDGKVYTVQYFERARFEWHPENPAPWDIELGQFGRRILTALDAVAPPPYPLAANMQQIYPSDTGVRVRLGPPTAAAAQVPGAFLPFQHGAMIWRGDTKSIYVIVLDPGRTNGGAPLGSWSSYPDTWDPSQGDVGGTAPVPTLYVPQRGFGKVWREHPELQQQLGYATAPAERAVTLYAQPFVGGLVLDGARNPSGQVDFFYTNGRAQWMMSSDFR